MRFGRGSWLDRPLSTPGSCPESFNGPAARISDQRLPGTYRADGGWWGINLFVSLYTETGQGGCRSPLSLIVGLTVGLRSCLISTCATVGDMGDLWPDTLPIFPMARCAG